MALAPTNLDPDGQIRNMLAYDDEIAAGAAMEVTGGTIEDNLHAIISQLNRIINATVAGNQWYTDINTPSSFEGGAQRGVNLLNTDLHNIERKRILKRVSAIALDIPVTTAATSTLTGTANFANTETVTIDAKTYTFQTTLTDVDGNVQIGVDLATSLSNLAGAINLTGTPGTDYALSMTIHPTVYSSAITATTLVATAKTQGSAADSIATTETGANASWPGATLGAGTGGGSTTDVVVLANSQLPSTTTAAIGAVTTQGLVVATATTNPFGQASLDEVTGANALQPKSMWELIVSNTGEVLTRTGGVADGAQVYGLAQSESATDGSTITGGSGNGLQISLVVRNGTGDDLELITAGDVPISVTIDYAYVRRDAFEDCPEEAWLGGGFVDSGVATTTRQAAYDNQGAGVVTTTTNATLDIGGGFIWEIGDSASAALMTFTEAGAASTVLIASGVGTYTNTAGDVDFTNGIQVDTSNTINLGITPDQIDFTANGTVTAVSASTMTFTADAANATLSTTTSGNVVVSSAGNVLVDGAVLSLDGTDTTNLTMTSSDAGTKTMTIAATNGGAGVANIDVDADGSIDLLAGGVFSLDGTGASNVTATSGSLTLSTLTTGSVLVDGIDGVEINSSSGAINIGNDANAEDINIGTGAALRTVTIGNATGSTGVDFDSGTAGFSFDSTTADTFALLDLATTGTGGDAIGFFVGSSSPDGRVTGSLGSLFADGTNAALWININGSTDWAQFDVGAVGGTLQAAYEAGNTIVTDTTNGDFDVSGTEAFSLDGGAASNVTVTGASADLTLSTGNTTVAGDVLVSAGNSSTAATVGGGVTVTAGDGATTAAGGAVGVTGGIGGSTDGSIGGAVTVAGGVSAATNGTGGAILIDGGALTGTGSDGAISIGSQNAGTMLLGVNGGGTRIATSFATGSLGTMSATADGVMSFNANATMDVNVTGAYTLDSTTSVSIDAATASNLTVTSATGEALTVSTVTSGDVVMSAASSVDIDAVASVDILAGTTFSIDGTGDSNVSATSGDLTLSSITTGDVLVTAADCILGTIGASASDHERWASRHHYFGRVAAESNYLTLNAQNTGTSIRGGTVVVTSANTYTPGSVLSASTSTTFTVDAGAPGISAGDFLLVTGASVECVNGLYQILTAVSGTLTIDTTPDEEFCKTSIGFTGAVTGTLFNADVCVMRCSATGAWEVADGTSGPLSYTPLGTTAGSTLQAAYIAGNTIVTDTTNGDFDVSGSEAISLDASAASNFTVAGAGLTLATTTSGTLAVSSAGTLDMDGVAVTVNGTAASNFTTTAADLTLSTVTSGSLNVTSAADVDVDGTVVTIDATSGGVSVDGTAASNFTVTGGALTLSTVTSGDVVATSAGNFDVNVTGGNVTFDATAAGAIFSADGFESGNTNFTAATAGDQTYAIGMTQSGLGTGYITLDAVNSNGTSGDGIIEMNASSTAGSAIISFANDAVAQTVNVATGAATMDVNVGNTDTGTTIDLVTGGSSMSLSDTGKHYSWTDKVYYTTANVDADAATNAGAMLYESTYISYSNTTEGNQTFTHNAGYTVSSGTNTYWVTVVSCSSGTTDTVTAFTNNGAATDPTMTTTGSATFAAGQFLLVTGSGEEENNGIYKVTSHVANTLTLDASPAAGEEFIHQQVTAETGATAGICLVTLSAMRVNTTGDYQISEAFSTAAGINYIDLGSNAATLENAWTNATGAGATLGTSGFTGSITDSDTYLIQTLTGSNNLLSLAAVSGADVVTVGNADTATVVDIDSGTGGTLLDSTGAISLDAAAASNFTVTAASADLTLSTGNTTVAGDVLVSAGNSSTAATVGGGVTVTAGDGATTAAGGAVGVTGGLGGATDGSIGGAVNITSGSSAATNGDSGAVNIEAGAETGTGDEGAINIGAVNAGIIQIGINGGGTTIADQLNLGSQSSFSLLASDGAINITGSDVADASANDISLNAGASSTAATDGASIRLLPGDGGTTGVHGTVDIDGAFDNDEAFLTLTGTGGSGNSDLYAGATAPTHTAVAGSLFLFNDGATATTGGRVYVQVDADGAGDDGSNWDELVTTATTVTRQHFQTTMTSTVSPTGTITSAEISGTLPSKPAANFTFNTDAEIYLNGILLYNGTDVASGTGDDLDVPVGGSTFRSGDVITISYYTNSTAG